MLKIKKMKNIFLIIAICFFTNSIIAQDYEKTARIIAKEQLIPEKDIQEFVKNFVQLSTQKTPQINIVAPQVRSIVVSNICDDGGFETKNIANWGWTMVRYLKQPGGSQLISQGIVSGVGAGLDVSNTFQSIIFNNLKTTFFKWELVSSGSDPIFPGLPRTHSGNRALRLGLIVQDTIPLVDGGLVNNGAEAIQKTITITNSNTNLSFWYALVVEDPGDGGHANDRSPAFGVRVQSGTSNISYIPISPIILGFSTDPINPYSGGLSHPFWLDTITERGQWTNGGASNNNPQETKIRPWTCGSVDLSGYLGQTITLEFVVNDCSWQGHFGYAYLDDICMGCEGSDMGDASLDGISSGCGPSAIVDGSYTLPYNSSSTGTLNSITATLYQNGTPVGTSITILPANINTTAKTFNFPMSIFGTVPAGDYDIVITASFSFLGSTYSTISDLAGLIPLTNNDWKAECPTPVLNCCNNLFGVKAEVVIPPSYPYKGGTYSIENFNVIIPNNIPITEIKVNVESFEIISAFKDCQKCENKPITLGSLMGIKTIGTGLNILTVANQLYGGALNTNQNTNEIIWSNPNGVLLSTNDKIGIIYLLPSSKEIPCCALEAKVCIRISWRDTECNYCEVTSCSFPVLKNANDLNPAFTLPLLKGLYLNAKGIFTTSYGKAEGF